MTALAQTLPLLFPAILALAASHDVVSRIIPNPLVAGLGLGFFAAAGVSGLPHSAIAAHAGCGFVVLAGGLLLFARGVAGGGDAKLAAAVALWLGWELLAAFLIATSLFGGGLAVLYLLLRLARGESGERRAPTLPYGAAIAAAGLYLFPGSALALASFPA
jgi:prepilin peptidase CpaA